MGSRDNFSCYPSALGSANGLLLAVIQRRYLEFHSVIPSYPLESPWWDVAAYQLFVE